MIQRPDQPDFQRFVTAIRGGCPDRVPVAEALVDNGLKAGILGRPIRSLADDVAFWAKAGYDFVPLSSGILDPAKTLSAKHTLGMRQDAQDQAGQGRQWAQEGKGQIASMADLDSYPWPSVEDMVPSHLTEAGRHMPAGMKVIPTTGKIFTAAWQMMGFESFCLSLYDQPGLVQALFERITALQVAGYERMCALSTVGGFWFSDDIAHGAGAFIAPTVLRRYIFPVYRRMVQIAHQAGRIAIFHSDGDLWPVIDDIIACGFDALHPIEPKAMDIVKVQAYARGRLALVGNIDIDFPFL